MRYTFIPPQPKNSAALEGHYCTGVYNKTLFNVLVHFGTELVPLHLMESPSLWNLITQFSVSGSHEVKKIGYQEDSKRVYINSEQYFAGVPKEVWSFMVGGYQVCHKWLKDRKGKNLSSDDIEHYQKIVVALSKTITIMQKIDSVISDHGGFPLQ